MTGFEHALIDIKRGGRWRRVAWHKGTFIYLTTVSFVGFDPFIAVYSAKEDKFAPWTPSRCDLLESDWDVAS